MWKFSAVYTNGLYWTSVEQDVVFKITFWLDLWFSNCGADPTASALTTIYKYDVKIMWINMIYFYKETWESLLIQLHWWLSALSLKQILLFLIR